MAHGDADVPITHQNLRIEEVTIPESSGLVGQAIRDANTRQKTKGLVIAVRFVDGRYA